MRSPSWYARSRLGCCAWLATYVGSLAVAEEVVQESWIAVFRSISTFEGRSSLRTWVFRICVHTSLRRATQEGRSQPFADAFAETDDGPTVDPGRFRSPDAREDPRGWASAPSSWRELPEERLLDAETRSTVEAAIEELPDLQRLVVVLRDVEGYTAEEVCEVLEIRETYQRVLLHRARARLRAVLEQYLEAS